MLNTVCYYVKILMISDIIKTLVAANKNVYTRIGFEGTDDWGSIFNPSDANVFQTTKFDPLINFLNTFKINGILINCPNLYDVSKIEHYL